MEREAAEAFARRWIQAWNDHDIEAVLADFGEDAVFSSPHAAPLVGGEGVVRGKKAIRRYWIEGLRRWPDLHFEVLGVYAGVHTIVINYRNQAGGLVNEVLTFDGELVVEGHGTYLEASP